MPSRVPSLRMLRSFFTDGVSAGGRGWGCRWHGPRGGVAGPCTAYASTVTPRSVSPPQSLDSLGTSEDTRSKRHSTSDLSDVTFSDVRKEGWLHYKQILTKKGKVRGDPRPGQRHGARGQL